MDDESVVSSGASSQARKLCKSELLCMLGISASIGCNELIDFVAPFADSLEYMRIVRDAQPNQYMALV